MRTVLCRAFGASWGRVGFRCTGVAAACLLAVIATAATAGLLLGTVPEMTLAGKPIAEACRGCAPSPKDIIAARLGGKSLPTRTVRDAGWRNLGPDLGAVWAPITIDPGGSGIIYTGSIGGGVRKSTDNGVTWLAVNDGLAPRAIYSLAMDAAGPEVVYAGTFSLIEAEPSGVYKSSDGGTSWTFLAEGPGIPFCITADPRTSGRIFVGGLGGEILRTLDGGDTWKEVREPEVFGRPVTSIVIDPNNPSRIYASGTTGSIRSTNGGWHWTAMSDLPQVVWALAIDPSNTHVLYAATNDNGIWRSSNSGATWRPLGTIAHATFGIMVDPTAHTLYASTSGGVLQSSDGGASWQQTSLSPQTVYTTSIGPGGDLYAGTSTGIALSLNLGNTWTDPDPTLGDSKAFGYAITVDPNAGKNLWVTTLGSTILTSQNRGTTWGAFDEGYSGHEPRKINIDPTNSNRIYLGSFIGGGLFKSVDGGATWERRVFGGADVYVWVPVIDPVSPNIVYAGTNGHGLFKSTNYGDTWADVENVPPVVQGITVDPRDHDVVFIATNEGILRSSDEGATWTSVLDLGPGWSITIVGGNSPVVYATLKRLGVFRSSDGGFTWEEINNGVTNTTMGRAAPVIIASNDAKVLYVGSEGGGGVFKSIDAGDSWFSVNLGLDDTSVFGLARDPKVADRLYASGPHGIWTTTTGGQ